MDTSSQKMRRRRLRALLLRHLRHLPRQQYQQYHTPIAEMRESGIEWGEKEGKEIMMAQKEG